MSILQENVKLMASQRLTDNDDGGGRMTGIEIIDGNVNNLFPDISRLDRVYGRVSLRKAFVSVQTADTEAYSGAHVILSLPAQDPNVSVCMFSTGDPNDERTEARNRLESYVTIGPRYQGWLWGDQPAGSRSLLIFQIKGSKVPEVGSVLCLIKDKGLATEIRQFVRVTKAEATTVEFTATSESSEYGSTAMAFNRDIVKLEIGDPLRETFPGIEISKNDSLATNLYTTTVSDASKYFGVMLPTAPVAAGQIEINVNSIYANLVPSAQGEAPVVDLAVGEAGPVVGSGSGYNFSVSSFDVTNGKQLHFGRGIKPKTLNISASVGGHSYGDDGNGILTEGTSQVGTVDYSTGSLTFSNISAGYTANLAVSATIGVEVLRVPNTMAKYVELSNRGYNYTAMLAPLPIPKTVWVDYMAQGKWYRLRDNGNGVLVPDIAGTGTGTVNYMTGSVILTCGALPDVETAIIYNWANPVETVDLSGEVAIDVAEITHTLASKPVNPGSFTMTWPVAAGGTGTATDDGSGYLTGDATGWINYATGEIAFKPTALPVADGEYTVDYDKYPLVEGTIDASGSGLCTFTLPQSPIEPGTVSLNTMVSFSEYPHIYAVKDDGNGNLLAEGWSIKVSVTNPTWPGSTNASGITGTIDYLTGHCTLDLTNVTGSETWKEPYTFISC